MTGAYRDVDATVSARRAAAVTFSDTAVIENTRALYVGSGGNVRVRMVNGGTVTFPNVAPGTILPIQVVQVFTTGTTVGAGNVIALY